MDGEPYCFKDIGSYSGVTAQQECEAYNANLPYPENTGQNDVLVSAMKDMKIDNAWLRIMDAGRGFLNEQ